MTSSSELVINDKLDFRYEAEVYSASVSTPMVPACPSGCRPGGRIRSSRRARPRALLTDDSAWPSLLFIMDRLTGSSPNTSRCIWHPVASGHRILATPCVYARRPPCNSSLIGQATPPPTVQR